jgi:hypothetical protein
MMPAIAGRKLTPDPPGPPGSMKSEPIRLAGSSAFCRRSAMRAIFPSGLE